MGEGIFLLFLTPAAPDYHVLRSEPRKHHSAMLQLGWLPSPARGRRRGAAGRGCERTSVCTRGPRGTASFSPSRRGMQPAAPRTGQKGRLLPANVFVFLVRLLIRLGLIAFESVVGFLGGFFLAFSLKSRDNNLHTVTRYAFPALSRAKTRNLVAGSTVHPLNFPSREKTAQHGKAATGEQKTACLVK